MPRVAGIPTYRLHKHSGQAIVTLTYGPGDRQDVLLGKFDTPASREEYGRVIAKWEAEGRRRPGPTTAPSSRLTIFEVLNAYWQRRGESYYRRPDGTEKSEGKNVRLALRRVKQLYGPTEAAKFDSLALMAVRDTMVTAGLARHRINKDIGRIKRTFQWLASVKLVPLEVTASLATMAELRRGEAKETPKVRPVSDTFVRETLPLLRPQVAAMVRLQRLTGMRPGEVTMMRTMDLDTSENVWTYVPGSDEAHGAHKNAWREQDRVIAIGPQAQAILRPWLRTDLGAYLFQPKEAQAQRHQERREARQSPMTPSQARRGRVSKPQRAAGDRYSVMAYCQAIYVACLRLEARRRRLKLKELRAAIAAGQVQRTDIPRWHPNQLRHAKATELRREFGIDAARVVLGHRSLAITETYAELDRGQAVKIMEKVG